MRRRTSLAAATAIGTVWALSACGIPTGRAPDVIGDAPTDFDQSSGVSPESFDPTEDAAVTVANFYKAAAGDPASRDDRLQRFTASEDEQFSGPGDGIRLLDDLAFSIEDAGALESATVTVTGSVVGIYREDGTVRVPPTSTDYSEIFTLQRDGVGDTWEMTTLPTQVALDYDYFTASYEQAPLYFQAGEAELLVPDLRWIYGDLNAGTRRKLLLDWLVLGPSEFAKQAAGNAIPPSTVGKIAEQDGVLQVDLSLGAEVEDDVADAIAAEVAWSLGLDGEFVLTADGEERARGTRMDWRDWNAIPAELPETAYFIAEETVWQYTSDEGVTRTDADHPWVGFTMPGLRQVAVGSGGRIAAITAGSGGEVLQTGDAVTGVRPVSGVDGALTDPQWLGDGTVIVVDDGVPIAVVPRTGTIQPLAAGDQVTALALSADGRRLAYVEDGLAWVAPLFLDADGNISAGQSEPVGTGIEDVSDVAWSSENFLWVAGNREDYKLFNVAIDNSRIEPQAGTVAFPPITEIAANPAEPVGSSLPRGEPVIIVANSTLYRVFTTPDEVLNGDVPVSGSAPFTVLQAR
ncbi:hypothetical protein K3N28_07215 [Glycomyces sp. TRM65418]|uniref:LpqB family beta-propeller domain-containing protein n=1 Tax=Glycomyces sp. TRM65418 TaxID=2867006 RepID=UPI001CE67BE8|nr:LpqB family beta-propeller domain-containing protein [Glycomyces sp. TRM65418]MCC3762860.1 hypothetical protein [Glycomyces sp. TRM65418]QZD56887.1 hypothetical protein K3N28_07165 [Glycomyces sp. TRM65418]